MCKPSMGPFAVIILSFFFSIVTTKNKSQTIEMLNFAKKIHCYFTNLLVDMKPDLTCKLVYTLSKFEIIGYND